jgi:hypothetical protein
MKGQSSLIVSHYIHQSSTAMQRFSQILITVAVCLLLSSPALAQNKYERVIRKAALPFEPVKVLEVVVREQVVTFGDTFVADDDWLEGMRFKLKNTSGKAIVRMEIGLYIPGSVTGGYPFLIPINFGPVPSAVDDRCLSTYTNKLADGNEVEVVFTPQHYKAIRQLFASKGINKPIFDIDVRLGMVIFDDCTAWSEGQRLRRDPVKPNKWNAIPLYEGLDKPESKSYYRIEPGAL